MRDVATRVDGLSGEEVAQRVAAGQVNRSSERTSRTLGNILAANLFTRFNFILGTLLVAILAVGQPRDALFGIVLVVNALIGIVQEVRAKRTLDRLAILHSPRAHVVRDGVDQDVQVDDVVLDEIVAVRTGDQVVADGVVRTSVGLQVDESLLTGEANPVDKDLGDRVLSGSFVVAGSGRFQATAVGPDAYARQLTAEARQFTLARSELMDGINRILRYITWAIVPVAAVLLLSQLHAGDSVDGTIAGVVAGLVGMVPQGLVLLTSVAFGVAAVTLSRRNVLVQQLPAIEGLARVDVVCLDKTGTLTTGQIAFRRIEPLDGTLPIDSALGALADEEDSNATLAALGEAFPAKDDWKRTATVPFSSVRKWSAGTFDEHGSWILGAPEIVLRTTDDAATSRAAELAATGQRVLALAHSADPLDGERLPADIRAAALVVFDDRLREDAAQTLAYFAEQNVATKIISGDSPRTVEAIVRRAGKSDGGSPVDARDLPEDSASLGRMVEAHAVFGRVTPQQKQAMVTALQARGHTVAMIGDGVNDALALKLADIGVAMGSGAAATRAVAQLVLLDGRFSTMPGVVAEGRRVIANIERVANVFITKTVWATVLAVAVSAALWPYPFLPRHLTIIDALTIGIPTFFLALAPNTRRYLPGFVTRVLRFAIPAGLVVSAAVLATYWWAESHDWPLIVQRTSATLVATMVGWGVLVLVALPLTWRRVVLVGATIAAFGLLFPVSWIRDFFALDLPATVLTFSLVIGSAGVAVLAVVWAATRRWISDADRPPAQANDDRLVHHR